MRNRREHVDSPPIPAMGDVVVSNPTATVEYDVSIVPAQPHLTTNHDSAVNEGRELAARLQVDLWLTEDHTHFLRLAAFRDGDAARDPAGGPRR